jgi:pilus assembly protein CpaB
MLKLSDLKILFIALAAAATIAVVVRLIFFVDRSPKEEHVEVVVATMDLHIGQTLEQRMIHLQSMPKSLVVPDYITSKDDQSNLVGSVVRSNVVTGEPLKKSEIIAVGQKGVLSALIDPGKRAYTIPLGRSSAVSSLISPGDLVDVIVAYRQQGAGSFVAKTILEGVRVLEIDGSFKKVESGSGTVRPPQYITIEVTEKQARDLAGELRVGEPTISLHSVKDTSNGKNKDTTEATPAEKPSTLPQIPTPQVPPVAPNTNELQDSTAGAGKADKGEIVLLRGAERTVVDLDKKNKDGNH